MSTYQVGVYHNVGVTAVDIETKMVHEDYRVPVALIVMEDYDVAYIADNADTCLVSRSQLIMDKAVAVGAVLDLVADSLEHLMIDLRQIISDTRQDHWHKSDLVKAKEAYKRCLQCT